MKTFHVENRDFTLPPLYTECGRSRSNHLQRAGGFFFPDWFNLLASNKILALSKLKKKTKKHNLIVAQTVQLLFDMVEKNVGKGENAGNHHFLLFPQCFQNAFSQGHQKSLHDKGLKT